MNTIMLIIALFMCVMQGFLNKKCSIEIKERNDVITFNMIRSLLCSVFALAAAVFMKEPLIFDTATILISSLAAVSLAVCFVCSFIALEEGAVVLVQMFSTAGLILPCLSGWFMFNEKFTYLQFFGLIVLIFATWLLLGYSKSLKGKTSRKLYLLLFLILISNGTTMLSQKMFGFYVKNGSVSTFSFLAFGIAGLLLFFTLIFGERKKPVVLIPKNMWLSVILMAIAVFSINQLLTIISVEIPSILLFPLYNGTGLVLITIVSAIYFKEKLTLSATFGLLIGIVSLVVINIK